MLECICSSKCIQLMGQYEIVFDEKCDFGMNKCQKLFYYINGMCFIVYNVDDEVIVICDYYLVGGGFVVNQDDVVDDCIVFDEILLFYLFKSGDELLVQIVCSGLSIVQLMFENEKCWCSEDEICVQLCEIWSVMQLCVVCGICEEGVLLGGLKVGCCVLVLYCELLLKLEVVMCDLLMMLDWVNLYVLVVNEENVVGGCVVIVLINGVVGVLLVVLYYFDCFCLGVNEQCVFDFFLILVVIGIFYKENVLIFGVEVGCQGEVGVVCLMVVGGLVVVLGGNFSQIENVVEIGMEYNLGLICDLIGGLVQIFCIECNVMGVVKVINVLCMVMCGDGKYKVLLDKVIKIMCDIGCDMQDKYKEISRGGLVVNVIEC